MSVKENGVINYKKNLYLILLETILSSIGACFCVSTITVFYNSIGMNQTDIGFVQMMFTVSICLLDIPLGYFADRFNRKILNIIGDIGVAITFLFYSISQDIYMVLISECVLGFFMAATNGVDQSFIKFNCDKIDNTGKMFKRVNVKVHTARYVTMLTTTLIGGFIAKYNLRMCIAVSFVPYFIGGIIACFVKDFGIKLEKKNKNLFKDMFYSIKEILSDKMTRTNLLAYIIGKEITHPQIWVFTPLLIAVGVPIEIVSLGWILSYAMQTIGSKISEKMIELDTSKKFGLPVMLEFAWIIVLIIHVDIITVWLFALNGFVHGLIEGNMATALQESAKDEVQTSIMSISSTGARLLYIPLVYIINSLGNIKLQYALIGVLIVFIPMCIFVYLQLNKYRKTK